jgi:N-formylglutamate deformylase
LLSDEDLRKELILMTDRYVPDLFAGIAASGGVALVNNYSRLVVDPERFESDEEEVMSSRGMGAVYTKTACQQILRKDLSATEKEDLLSTYFRPYHEAVRKEVQGMLERFDRCLIIDCHSFPSKPLPYELDQSSDRTCICIGTDRFHTPNELINLLRSFCDANGIKVAINKPFAGTYVPQMHLRKDKRVSSIMVEVNRSLYMNEKTGDRSSQFSQTKEMIDALIKQVIGFEAAGNNAPASVCLM